MELDRLADELQIATQLAFSQAACEKTADSIRANTTLNSAAETKVERWQSARRIPLQTSTPKGDETLSLMSLASAISCHTPPEQGDLSELRALVAQVRQLHKMRRQLGAIDSHLGRTWQSAVQCERAALMAQERLKLACSSEAPKEPIAEVLIIYLTQLKNSMDR